MTEGATIAIQNDPTSGGRSVLLQQDKGVIELKPGVGFKPTVADIVENPRTLKIVEIDAAQTPRSKPTTPSRLASTRRARSCARIPRGPT